MFSRTDFKASSSASIQLPRESASRRKRRKSLHIGQRSMPSRSSCKKQRICRPSPSTTDLRSPLEPPTTDTLRPGPSRMWSAGSHLKQATLFLEDSGGIATACLSSMRLIRSCRSRARRRFTTWGSKSITGTVEVS